MTLSYWQATHLIFLFADFPDTFWRTEGHSGICELQPEPPTVGSEFLHCFHAGAGGFLSTMDGGEFLGTDRDWLLAQEAK